MKCIDESAPAYRMLPDTAAPRRRGETSVAYPTMRLFPGICLMLLIAGCSVTSEHRDWHFMQRVGGLTVVGQDKNPGWLVVRGNVSGLKEFSHKPDLVNSGLTVKEMRSKVTNSKIQIFVITTLSSDRYPSPEINGVDISGIAKGTYRVEYLNPDGSTVYLSDVDIH